MKCKIFIAYAGCILQGFCASSFLDGVVRIMDNIPLIDGKTLLGKPISYQLGTIDLEKIDQDVFRSLNTELECRKMLKNPIKSKGWISETYYTPEEFSRKYRELVQYSFLLNPAALRFYRDVLEYGNVYGLKIPGLKPQPERACLFKEAYDWTLDIKKPPLFLEHLQRAHLNAEIEAAEESKKHQEELDAQKKNSIIYLEIDDHSNKTKSSTIRQRHIRNDSNKIVKVH
ncbi:MAG: hypothetical protein HEEMFOPI_01424 [Holosporales bacterium]